MINRRRLAKGFVCMTCGAHHRFDMYVYAHERDVLDFRCDCCERPYKVVMCMASPARARQTDTATMPTHLYEDEEFIARVTREEFEAMSPYLKGFTVYMMGARKDQPAVPRTYKPATGYDRREYTRGQEAAAQAVMDIEG